MGMEKSKWVYYISPRFYKGEGKRSKSQTRRNEILFADYIMYHDIYKKSKIESVYKVEISTVTISEWLRRRNATENRHRGTSNAKVIESNRV